MNEREIIAAFAAFDPGHPFYKAVSQLLDNAVTAEQDAVTDPNLTDSQRHYNAGRLAHAKDIRALLPDTVNASRVEQARMDQAAELAAQRQRAEQG